jgi:Mor family transcriptional regulator
MKQTKEAQILRDREELGLSIRSLGNKYGMSRSRIHRMVLKGKGELKSTAIKEEKGLEELPNDVTFLKAMLRKEQLKNELLNNVIEVASKELGIDIRKKRGTRQSD